jgi:MFS family permease
MNVAPRSLPYLFKRLIAARALSTVSSHMQAVVLGWQMYVLTQSALCIGLIGLAEAVPALGLALFGGAVVDRGNPERIFRNLLALSFISTLLLLVSHLEAGPLSAYLVLGVRGDAAALYVSSFLTGISRAFYQPSIYAMVPRIVPRSEIPHASAWMTLWLQVARVSGPALGGVFFACTGVVGAACIGLLLLVVAAFLTIEGLDTDTAVVRRRMTLSEVLVGARFVFSHPVLLPALSLDMISVLLGGVTALLPIYAAEVLFVGAMGVGILRAAPALGAASMGFVLTKLDIRERAGVWLLSAVAGFGFSTLLFAVSPYLVLSCAALFLAGAFDSVSVVVRSSSVQLFSPDEMRGRISAVNSMFIGSSNELGEVESGVLAHFIGVVPTAVVGALACIVTAGVATCVAPGLRGLNLKNAGGRP